MDCGCQDDKLARDGILMKTLEQIRDELRELETAHYYSEDFEWLSAVRAYRSSLSEQEAAIFRSVVYSRLLLDGSMTDVLLCSVDAIPGAVSILATKLDAESATSQLTRALITTLQGYADPEAFRAVVRFVDSGQEAEALRALGMIDFARALPFIARAVRKEYHRDLVLHILHDRVRAVGSEALVRELRRFAAGWSDPELITRLCNSLRAKMRPYNPFPEEDVRRISEGLLAPADGAI